MQIRKPINELGRPDAPIERKAEAQFLEAKIHGPPRIGIGLFIVLYADTEAEVGEAVDRVEAAPAGRTAVPREVEPGSTTNCNIVFSNWFVHNKRGVDKTPKCE